MTRKIRRVISNLIAQELNLVQPIDPTIYAKMMAEASTEEQLMADGYEPVSSLKLMWIKKGKPDGEG